MRMTTYRIAPSILSANFAKLGDEIAKAANAGADLLHVDVMDNHFVPNLTFGPLICQALSKAGCPLPMDVHLMTKPVDNLIPLFAKAGAAQISFHPEAADAVETSIRMIADQGCKVGLAINPDTSIDVLANHLDMIDYVLVMSVYPGFAGQAFIPESLDKVRAIKQLIAKHNKEHINIAIDGGINKETIVTAAIAGADTFVMGSAFFSQANYADFIREIRHLLAGG